MSHSVFRDLDEDKSSGTGSKGDVADNNLIVFIDKDDDVRVNPNALQDFIVNANTDTKSTVSVIRVGSPTPSMEVDDDDENSKSSDAENDSHSNSEVSISKSGSESNPNSDEDEAIDKNQKSNHKKRKNRKKVRSFGLTVEDFYNPEQAVNFATEIMNIAGITDPKQLKADYEHLRYIIANDHCYTPYTYADSLSGEKSVELTDGAKGKPKLVSTTSTTSTVQSITSKKNSRNAIVSKSHAANGLDRDTSSSMHNRSVDDANSSTENTGERSSDEEEAESEEDFSDMTPSDTDNDRDSDLDFKVADCHSRRTKKISKRKIRAKKLAAKKRRRSTVDFTGSDDGSTPNRKKTTKLPKKLLNTSAKSSNNQTSTSTQSTATKTTTVAPITSTVKSPIAVSTMPKLPVTQPTIKSLPVTTMPRITKVTYIKQTPHNLTKVLNVQKVNSTISAVATTITATTTTATTKPTTPASTTTKATASTTPIQQTASTPTSEHKPRIFIVKQKDRKAPSDNISLSGMSSLFAPDVIKKQPNPTGVTTISKNPITIPSLAVSKTSQSAATSKTLTPITVHAFTTAQPIAQRTILTKSVKSPVITYPRKVPKPNINLASEQDKQLELIDSLVQEELNRTETDTASQANVTQTAVPAAIPNIVKMLETSDAPTPLQTAELSTQQPTSTSNSISYTTTSSVTDSQMLPDDLLQSFVNSDDLLTDELMQHVAKLVEDKNVQEIIDQSIGSMSSCPAPVPAPTPVPAPVPTPPAPIQTVATEPKMNEPIQTTTSTLKLEVEEPKTPANIAKSAPNTPATAGKEGIKVKRKDGLIITLPPIEAPTTRGAKRRAEIAPGSDVQPKQKVFTVIVQTETPNTPKNVIGSPSITASNSQCIKSPTSANAPKANPIGVRERRASVAVKRASIESKPRRSMSISNPPPRDGDDDDEEEDGSDGSYNSEDDPHRLWCICRTPHNNRFMICCDKCEEWFHGKCVGITRQMGREMEERQSEWICPNCVKKQQPSIKNIFPRKLPTDSPSIKIKNATTSSDSSISNCIVCGIKPSRVSSVYCSDDCIRKHASTTKAVGVNSVSNTNDSDSTNIITTSPSVKSPVFSERKIIQPKIMSQLFKDKANHVVVVDKSTGKYLTGKNAPTSDRLKQWLAEHPNHEVLKPGTPQAAAFKAKQQQLKSLAKNMNAERELFAVTQPNKIQTKLRFEADKMVCVNPTSQKQVTTTTTALKRSISATSSSSSPVHTKSPVPKTEFTAKTPKLTSTPAQKTTPTLKKRSSEGKTSTTPTHSKSESSSSSSSNERDRLRVNARKTLIEQLIARTKEIADPNSPRLTEVEITVFVKAAEQEMFDMFGGDTNMKYKAKYRSLMYNIKDRKNLTLFEKISKKMIEPKKLVRMSTEELASQELAEWRNNETKHQLEMITKSELDLLASGNTYVLKTHKGEEVIQESSDRISLNRSLPGEDLVSALNSSTVSSSDGTVTKDSRFDKYLSPDGKSSLHSSSNKRDGNRSHEKKSDRHETRSGGSSSKHKRKRSRERHSSHSHSSSSHSHRDKKERSSGSDSRRDKKRDEHKSGSSSSRSKHHSDKDRNKREASNNSNSSNSNSNSSSTNKAAATQKAQKREEVSIIDKILKAESTINSILHPQEFKKTTVETSNAGPMNISSGSLNESTTAVLARQPSAANESDQEPTSTVTSPPAATPEFQSTTPPPIEKPTDAMVWCGNINMIDVATFQVSLNVLSGSTAMIDFPKEFDVVGRISPDTVWDYLDKIRVSKDIVLLRFSPRTMADDGTAYSTFITYLDSRQRLGVIKIPSKMVKDFYILPLTSHKSLPSILKSTTGYDFGADRPDLLLGIIVRNRMTPNATVHIPPPKYRQPISYVGHKPVVNIPVREEHYTPPSSPNINPTPVIAKPVIKSFATNLDDDEPYSPGGSDEDDLTLDTIPYLSSSNAVNPITDYTKPLGGANTMSKFDQDKLDELNRQIEAEKKQIAMHLGTVDIDEPYSPSSSVSPPINPNLSNISIPANLADILNNIKNVASFGTVNQMPSNQYSSMMDTSDNEYVPVASASTSMSYAPAQLIPTPSLNAAASQPSKLAQLTDEELLRLVPDEID